MINKLNRIARTQRKRFRLIKGIEELRTCPDTYASLRSMFTSSIVQSSHEKLLIDKILSPVCSTPHLKTTK